jgi:hyperosmotically inducible protein
MRFGLALLCLILLSGCTALVVGGAGTGAYQTREAAVVTSDSAITTKIKGRYAADPVVGVFNIGVRTYNGTVTLTGAVGSFAARDQAGKIAKDTEGVSIVNNQIVVEDQSDPR